MPLIVKLADRIRTVEALASESDSEAAMCRAIRYMRQAKDLIKGTWGNLHDMM